MISAFKEVFHSKIMLFGEYAIILGSKALTIPFSHFNAQLSFVNQDSYTDLDFARLSHQQLKVYVQYLIENLEQIDRLLRIEELKADLHNGLFLESTIPESYGLGSSGALVAAIYKRYGYDQIEISQAMSQKERLLLKSKLASLEGYFHGTSSGIDPLICYMGHPLCIENDEKITSVTLPMQNMDLDEGIFIVDTGKPGKTAPLVSSFLYHLNDDDFHKQVYEHYIPLTNQCIQSLIEGDRLQLFELLDQLSHWQLSFFEEMIPVGFQHIWKDGLQKQLFAMKLCGSGGGGYALGFTRHFSQTRQYFREKGVELIPVYQMNQKLSIYER